jgi:hypothetical protein
MGTPSQKCSGMRCLQLPINGIRPAKSAEFPVFSPVSREFERREVRKSLRPPHQKWPILVDFCVSCVPLNSQRLPVQAPTTLSRTVDPTQSTRSRPPADRVASLFRTEYGLAERDYDFVERASELKRHMVVLADWRAGGFCRLCHLENDALP